MKLLPIFQTDAYKQFHHMMLPEGITWLHSNMTPRSFKRLPGCTHAVFFGLQYYIKKYLVDEWNIFFSTPFSEIERQYKRFHKNFSGCEVTVDHWKKLHDLGYMPIVIMALPEGSLVPEKVPFYTIWNTHPDFAWLVNFLETQMSAVIWDMTTVATIARMYRQKLDKWAEKTGDPSFVQWQGHDFAMRGRSSMETAYACQAGHLLSFAGTDTIPAVFMLEDYYDANMEKELVGGSVPATEHSIQTAYGKENEIDGFKRVLEQFPSGIVSIVSDSFDLWKVCTEYVTTLKDKIMSRNGKLVIRPDCYDEKTEILTSGGWKLFKDLNPSDLVAQVLDDGSREFVKPLKVTSQYYEGDMHHFADHHGKVDLLVTPWHRMILQQNGKERIAQASELPRYGNSEQKMIRSASAPSNPSKKLTQLERLRIAFQADGSFCTDCNSNKIRFSFSKQRKIDRMKNILNSLNIEYKIYDLSDGRFEFNITLEHKDFEKNFDWVDEQNLSKEWCQEFIEECSYWDSHRRSDDRFKFDTTVLSVADKVEFIGLSAGYGVLKSFYQDERKEIFSDVITLHILKNNTVGGQSWENKTEYYSGNVYCVTVPTGRIFVRRNRCTMVCGNSGDPVDIVCGTIKGPIDYNFTVTNKEIGVVELLWNVFGGTVNEKGYKVLDPHIGVIYGDSITLDRAEQICQRLADKGFASTNVVLGIGSYTYNYNTRDTLGIAVKSTYCEVMEKGVLKKREIFKDPITDDGVKKSARGLLCVKRNENGKLYLKDRCTEEEERDDSLLTTVFHNGSYLIESFAAIKERLQNEKTYNNIKKVLNG